MGMTTALILGPPLVAFACFSHWIAYRMDALHRGAWWIA
jgi:hypothetical protein